MESVAKAKERLGKYPLLLAKCSKQGTLYARCVLLKDEALGKDACAQEFKELMTCIHSAAKDMKTRI